MVISAIILLFLFMGSKENYSRQNTIDCKLFYTFVAKMISDTAGSKAKPYFPFIFSLFIFVYL